MPRWGGKEKTLSAAIPLSIVVATLAGCGGTTFEAATSSMSPTIQEGDEVAIDESQAPEVGDVVLYHPPSGFEDPNACAEHPPDGSDVCIAAGGESDESTEFLHRIVGVGGDRIEMIDGSVLIDGEPDVGYETKPCDGTRPFEICDFPEIEVPPGYVFVAGDNRGSSLDSRFFGFIPDDWVVGVATEANGESLDPSSAREADQALISEMVDALGPSASLPDETVSDLLQDLSEAKAKGAVAIAVIDQAELLGDQGYLTAASVKRLREALGNNLGITLDSSNG